MNNEQLSIKSVIEDYIAKTGNDKLNVNDILRFANNAIDRIVPATEFSHRILLADIKDYKVKLPFGFNQVLQAAYLDTTKYQSCRSEQVTEYAHKIYGSDCKLVTSVECEECATKGCKSEVIHMDVDYNYLLKHPGEMAKHSKFFLGERSLNGNRCGMHNSFQLMRRTSNYFYNIPYHVNDCINVNTDSFVEYDIQLPNLITNVKEGQVLIAYLSKNVDSEGYLMIPNVPIVYDAVIQCIEERLGYIDYRKSKSPQDKAFWQDALQLKEKMVKRARMFLDTIKPDEWEMFIRTHWVRKTPNYLYEAKHNKWDGDKHDPRIIPRF